MFFKKRKKKFSKLDYYDWVIKLAMNHVNDNIANRKCFSDEILDKLPPSRLVFVQNKDGYYHPAILESINKDGTVTVIESNKK